MKKISFITLFLLITHFLFSLTVEDLELKLKSIIESGETLGLTSLIGLEISGDFTNFLNDFGSFTVGDVKSDLSGYRRVYKKCSILVMTRHLDNGVESLVDIKIISMFENEYLRNQSGFIKDMHVDFLSVITSEDTPFRKETIDTYRLVYYFDADSESIIDVTDRELIVYND